MLIAAKSRFATPQEFLADAIRYLDEIVCPVLPFPHTFRIAELLECFQWSDKDFDLQHVKEELADVIVYSQNLLDKLNLDADEIVNMKMAQNEAKYPVEKAKGSSAKYTEL